MKSNRFWLILLAVLLAAASLVGWLFLSPGGTQAVISQDGTALHTIDLDRVTQTEILEIEGAYHNTIEIEHGRIRVVSADCPDQVCVRTGWIEDGTKPIVCLPNRLVIEITGGDAETDIAIK